MASRLDEDQRAGYCRHCGERLPLIKRVKREEFCSEDHRERYVSSTQSVALSRLRETDLGSQFEPAGQSVAVAEEPAYAPDPPMAGTIGPPARSAPWRLAAVFDGDEDRLGQWELARPEPQWHHLVLEFGLAEFSFEPASLAGESIGGAALGFDTLPAEPFAALALPRNGIPLDRLPEQPEDTPPPVAEAAQGAPMLPEAGSARRLAPVPEPVEIDSTLYLPAFSPSAALESLDTEGWAPADWVWEESGFTPNGIPAQQVAIQAYEALESQPALELPLASGCAIEPEPEPRPTASLDELLDQIGAITAPPSRTLEERGMSEVQSIAERTGPQGLGERIANPFLHEPQPRPGLGTPRWAPVTVSLGTSVEGSTEDWDIL